MPVYIIPPTMYVERPSLFTIAELLLEDASLVAKPEVFGSHEHQIIYMIKFVIPACWTESRISFTQPCNAE